jgi:hypothetical protein
MEGNSTILGIFCFWWYRETFSRFWSYVKTYFAYLADLFSVRICFNTIFDPWKRDKISYEGLALKEKFEAIGMNLASRLVGAIVKIVTISSYLFVTIIYALLAFSFIVIWLLFPLIFLFLIVLAAANA